MKDLFKEVKYKNKYPQQRACHLLCIICVKFNLRHNNDLAYCVAV